MRRHFRGDFIKKTWALLSLMLVSLFALSACGGGGSGSGANPASNNSGVTTYTVTYNGNGSTAGSIPSGPANYTQGQTVTVAGNTGSLVKSGYSFAGWNTQANGGGTSYTQGQTFTMGSANATLYAKWGQTPRFAYVADYADNTISIYTVDSATGQLRHNGYVISGKEPSSVTADPSGKFAYTANYGDNTISVFEINGTTGALTSDGSP